MDAMPKEEIEDKGVGDHWRSARARETIKNSRIP